MALTDNLVSYWKFDGNGTDSHGSNTLTVTGATATSSAILGSAYTYTTNDYMNGGDILDFSGTGDVDSPFSFSFWVKVSSWNQRGMLVSRYADTVTTCHYALLIYDNKIYFNLYDGRSVYIGRYINNVSAYPTNEWVHLVFTYDGSETSAGCTIYKNGSAVDDTTLEAGTYTGMNNGNVIDFNVGRRANAQLYLTGGIDELGAWSRELTSTEVGELYNSGDGLAYPFTTGTGIGKVAKVNGVWASEINKINGKQLYTSTV